MSRYILAVLVAVSICACHGEEIESEYDMTSTGTETPWHWHWPWSHTHHVAFSAYLTEDKELEAGEKIVFNEVLLDDGENYDRHTGVFKVPHDGVYLFTFVIAQRHKREIKVNLKVDNEVVVGAVAEGRHRRHDAQGTNTVILHLHKGQKVCIDAVNNGHLEGNGGRYRYTTFSGHMVYCLE